MSLGATESGDPKESAEGNRGFTVIQAYPDRSENPKLVYPLKLHIEIRNNFGDAVRLYNPRWVRSLDGWPNIPPSLVKLKESRNAKDADSVAIAEGKDFFAWVAFDPKTVSEDEIRRRRERRQIGALELTALIAGEERHVRVPL